MELPRPRQGRRPLVEREPEVGQQGDAVPPHEDVRGLDVAVQEPLGVHGDQGARDVAYDGNEERLGVVDEGLQRTAVEVQGELGTSLVRARVSNANQVTERQAVDPLHRVGHDAGLVDDVVDRDDVGMADAGHRTRLAQEALARAGLVRGEPGSHLERDPPSAQTLLSREIDGPHAPAAELALDLVAGHVGPDRGTADADFASQAQGVLRRLLELGMPPRELGGVDDFPARDPPDGEVEHVIDEAVGLHGARRGFAGAVQGFEPWIPLRPESTARSRAR